MAFYTIKTLSAIKTSADDKQRRKMLLLLIGCMQIVLMWWLGYSGHLNQASAASVGGPPASAPATTADSSLSAAAAAATLEAFKYAPGFLSEKNEVKGLKDGALHTVVAAAALCAKNKDCGGFTFAGAKDPVEPVAVNFKTVAGAEKVTKDDKWHTYQKKA